MEKVLLIDNYDSFTYNLYHYLEELWPQGVEVVRNDELASLDWGKYSKVVLSPGPGLPKEAGDLMKILPQITQSHSVLGICLGLQAVAETFNYPLKQLNKVVHGQSNTIFLKGKQSILFKGLPDSFKVGRYHSWVADFSYDGPLVKTAVDKSGEIMALEHRKLPVYAVQFHPESILSDHGKEILRNWLY